MIFEGVVIVLLAGILACLMYAVWHIGDIEDNPRPTYTAAPKAIVEKPLVPVETPKPEHRRIRAKSMSEMRDTVEAMWRGDAS